MNKLFVAALVATPLLGCGDAPDQSVNPSDVATLATGAAVIDSQIDDESSSNSNPGFNNFFSPNSNDPGSNDASNAPNNDASNISNNDSVELSCSLEMSISGAESRSYNQTDGCGTGVVIFFDQQTLTWSLDDSWFLSLEGAPVREADDTSDFGAQIRIGPRGSLDLQTGWQTSCTVSLSSAVPYRDEDGDQHSLWTGTVVCPNPATPVESVDLGDWMEVDGDPITIDSFDFTTPQPRAD